MSIMMSEHMIPSNRPVSDGDGESLLSDLSSRPSVIVTLRSQQEENSIPEVHLEETEIDKYLDGLDYKSLQRVAKYNGLPCRFKRETLESIIKEKVKGNDENVNMIIKSVKEERTLRKQERCRSIVLCRRRFPGDGSDQAEREIQVLRDHIFDLTRENYELKNRIRLLESERMNLFEMFTENVTPHFKPISKSNCYQTACKENNTNKSLVCVPSLSGMPSNEGARNLYNIYGANHPLD